MPPVKELRREQSPGPLTLQSPGYALMSWGRFTTDRSSMELVAETQDGGDTCPAASAGEGRSQGEDVVQLLPFLDLVQLHVPAAEDALPGEGELRRRLHE